MKPDTGSWLTVQSHDSTSQQQQVPNHFRGDSSIALVAPMILEPVRLPRMQQLLSQHSFCINVLADEDAISHWCSDEELVN